MKVMVKASGLMAGYLPDSDRDDGVELQLPDGTTVGGLTDRIGLPGDKTCLVVVNDVAVPLKRRTGHVLHDGDSISIVPPLKGG